MNNVRKVLALILCLCLMAPVCALASEGDAVLARSDYSGDGGFRDSIYYTCVLGEELVLIGGEGVYTWKVGEADLTKYTWDESYEQSESKKDPDKGEVIGTYRSNLAAFSDGEDVYIVYGLMENYNMYSELQYVSLWKVVLDGDSAGIVEVEDSELDWEALTQYYEEDSYPNSLQGSVYLDGVLYGVSYGDNGMEAYAIPIDGSYSDVLDGVTSPNEITAYKDGKVLFMCYDYGADQGHASFVAWDPKAEEAQELCTIAVQQYNYPVGIAYDEASDRVYYVQSGAVLALDLNTGETEEVNDMPVISSTTATMLPGGFYVLSGYDAIVVRNTDPSKRAKYRLAISNPSYMDPINSAVYTFSNVRGDVSVSVDTNFNHPRIIEDMMNRSTDYDIYILDTTDQAFDSVFRRGYMAEITGSEKIDKLFADMYPSIAEQLSADGVPVALPLTVYASSSLGVNKASLEKAGLTMDDIPTNWPDLLDNLDEINAKLDGTGVPLFYNWYTVEDMRYSLFAGILEDYMTYMNQTDPEMGFNTDVLRTVLQKLDDVDFEALGLRHAIINDEVNTAYDDTDDLYNSEPLLDTYVSCTLSGLQQGYIPLLLGITPQASCFLRLDLGVAFINPYSENKEIAVQFLESALDNAEESAIASLCDTETEPKRSRYYEESKAQAEQELAALQDALANAEEVDKQSLEEQIRDTQNWLEIIEDNYWDISPNAIEWYRSHDDALVVETYNVLYNNDSYDEISTYINQYMQGEINAEQMLQSFDKKLQMIILEGN